MDKINEIFAKNIVRLRIENDLTQLELAEKLNYSDKAVSRWERGEAIPDAKALVRISEMFDITVDELLRYENPRKFFKKVDRYNRHNIERITFIGVWTLALLTFIVSWLCGNAIWLAFVYALPVSLLVLTVFSFIWNKQKFRLLFLSLFCWSVILAIYLSGLNWAFNWWPLFFLGLPAQIIIYLCFKFRRKRQV